MSWQTLSFAFLAGNVAAVNPCGFVMLPAFAAWVLGDDGAAGSATWLRLWRAVRLGVAVTAAFVAVFAVAGVGVSLGTQAMAGVSQWLALLVGVGLVGYGLMVALGRGPSGVRLPNPAHERGGGSALLFGAGYAIVSLSCTLPVFLSVAGVSLSAEGTAVGAAAFVAYALGMGTVVMGVALAVALARQRLVGRLRAASRHVARASGGLLAAVGVYVIAYAAYSLRVTGPGAVPGEGAPAPIAWVTRLSSEASQLMASSTGRLAAAVVVAAVALVVVAVGWRRLRAARVAPRRPAAVTAGDRPDSDDDHDGEEGCCR